MVKVVGWTLIDEPAAQLTASCVVILAKGKEVTLAQRNKAGMGGDRTAEM